MNKWVSIQSLLAQEEDKHKESSANNTASTNNKESNDTPPEKTLTVQTVKPTDQIKDQKPKLISKNSKINNNIVQEQQTLDTSPTSDTSLVSENDYAYFPTSLTLDTSLVSPTIQYTTTLNQSNSIDNSLWTTIPFVKGHTKFYNQIIDHLYPLLDPYEQAIYTQLFRLSWGYGKDYCNIGLPRLAERANISVTATQQALKRLAVKKLVIKTGWTIGKGKDQGTEYKIPIPLRLMQDTSLAYQTRLVQDTSLMSSTTNKDHHDDLKKYDHHQATTNNIKNTNFTEHEKMVMMIYKKLTENNWTKADHSNYEKVKSIDLEKIEIAIKLAMERANNRPNSFAYFVKEILSVASPKTNRSKQKKAMQKIIEQIKNSKIGTSYSISDLSYWVKEACLRDDIAYDTDLFDELSKTG